MFFLTLTLNINCLSHFQDITSSLPFHRISLDKIEENNAIDQDLQVTNTQLFPHTLFLHSTVPTNPFSLFIFSGLPDAENPQQRRDPEQRVAEQWSPGQHGAGQAHQSPEGSEQRLVPVPEAHPGPDRGGLPGPKELQLQGAERLQ